MSSKQTSSKQKKKGTVIKSTAAFAKLLRHTNAIQHFQLRLYITGTTPRSIQAIANIRSLCEEYLPGRYHLEVVDIYQQPVQAAKEQIIAAPTLVKEFPIPPKRLIGNLSDREKVIVALNLRSKDGPTKRTAKKTQWAKL